MSPQFNPVTDSREFRNALGRYATGIAVVTTTYEEKKFGITVNSFSSVSLDPPMVLWSPDKSSARYDAFINSEHYAVHILSAQQKPICDAFTKSPFAFDRFDHSMNKKGVPILDKCLAVFECCASDKVDAGDHTIILGQVKNVRTHTTGDSLIFAHGNFSTAKSA